MHDFFYLHLEFFMSKRLIEIAYNLIFFLKKLIRPMMECWKIVSTLNG
jgi:hypothetical protein